MRALLLFGFVLGEVSKCHKQELQKQWGYQKVSAPNFSCGTAQTNNTLFVSAQRYYFCTFQTVYGLYKLRWFKWRTHFTFGTFPLRLISARCSSVHFTLAGFAFPLQLVSLWDKQTHNTGALEQIDGMVLFIFQHINVFHRLKVSLSMTTTFVFLMVH